MKKSKKNKGQRQNLRFETERYAVIKNSKGKVIERRKIKSQEQYNRYRQSYKSKGSFHSYKVRFQLANVMETEDWRGQKSYRGRTGEYQYQIRGVAGRNEVVARSNKYPSDYPLELARNEALINFYKRVADSYGRGYDVDIGKRIEDKGGVTIINEGVVRYERR